MSSKAKFACDSRYLLTFYFCFPVLYDEKDIFFFGVSSRRSCRSSQDCSASAVQPTDWRTIKLKSSHTVTKVLGPTIDFPTWDLAKGLRTPREFDFEGQWALITELPQHWGNRDSWRHKQSLMCTRTQEKGAVTSQETEPDLPVSVQESLVEACVNSGLLEGQEHWLLQSWEVWCAGISPFWRRSLLPHHSSASGQPREKEHSLTHQQKNGLKIYWAWPCP